MRAFNTQSLTAKLFLIILVAIFPFFILALYTAYQELQVKVAEAKNESYHQGFMAAKSQKNMIDQVALLLDAAAAEYSSEYSLGHDPAVCDIFLNRLLGNRANYANLLILQTDGSVACSAAPTTEWIPPAPAVERALQSNMIVPVIIRMANPYLNMAFLKRMPAAQDHPTALSVALINPSWFTDQAQLLDQTFPGAELMVADAAGEVLTRYPAGEKDLPGALPGAVLAAVQAGRAAAEDIGLDGVRRFYGIHSLSYGPDGRVTYIIAGIPAAPVHKAVFNHLMTDLLVIGLTLLVSLIAAILIERWLVIRWLQPLIQMASRLQAGDYSARSFTPEGGGELGTLARAFNHMAEALEQNERQLKQAAARYYNLFTGVPVGLYRSAPQGKFIDANPALRKMLSLSDEPNAEMPDIDSFFVDSEERERWSAELNQRGEITNYELRIRGRDGQIITVLDSAKAVRDDEGIVQYYEGSLQDITERKQAEATLYKLAYRDPLTGLMNRKAFEEQLEQWLARARRGGRKLAVLFIDLDNFKTINDSFGHDAGDAVLVEVARRLRAAVRLDDLIARLSGDEFILLVEITGREDAAAIARRILAEFHKPFPYSSPSAPLTPSIGISLFPEDGQDPQTLVKRADQAMYIIKGSGKASFSFAGGVMQITAPC